MWAYTLTAPLRIERIEVPAPEAADLRDGEVLLRFLAGGICGSDLPRYRGEQVGAPSFRGEHMTGASLGFRTPGYPLHEIVGGVVASRSDLQVGQRVVGWASDVRGLAEYLIAEAEVLVAVASSQRSALIVPVQPMACALYALGRLPEIRGARTAVIGLGPMGVLFAHGLRTAGAATVAGVDRVDRSDIAEAFGIDDLRHATSRAWARSVAVQRRPNIIIETVGHQVGTLNDAIEACAQGGHIYYFGIPDEPHYPIAFTTFLRKDLTLQAGSTRGRRQALQQAAAYLEDHPDLAARYVTDVLPVTHAAEAFERANNPRPGQLKIVLEAPDGVAP